MTVLTGVVAFTVAIGGLGSKFLSLGSLQGARVHERLNENPMEEVAEQIWAISSVEPQGRAAGARRPRPLQRTVRGGAASDAVQTLLRRGPERSPGGPAPCGRRRGPDPRTGRAGRRRRALAACCLRGRLPRVLAVRQRTREAARPPVPRQALPAPCIQLPTLNRTQVSGYLAGLLDVAPKDGAGGTGAAELLARIREAPQEVGPGSLDERMVDLMSEARGLGDTTRQGLAEAVLEARRTNPERATQQSHILEQYAELLEPNPRATKRFLMAYNVAFAARLTEGAARAHDPRPVDGRGDEVARARRVDPERLPDGDLSPVDEPGHRSGLLLATRTCGWSSAPTGRTARQGARPAVLRLRHRGRPGPRVPPP